MKREILLEHLEAAAAAMSVKLSYEAMNASVGNGGLCRVKGELRVIIDRRASTQERVATLAESLSRLDSSDVVVVPQVREVLEYYVSASGISNARSGSSASSSANVGANASSNASGISNARSGSNANATRRAS